MEIVQKLFSCQGVKFFLSERLCQDPLEKYFGKRGASNDNPNMKQFLDNTASLRVINSIALDPVRGNCKPELQPLRIDETPLPKRKKNSTR